jgi:polyphosphate kinase
VIRQRDVLLHHPYESYSSVVDFLELAAADPHVLAIKQTLYRTGGDARIVGALMNAVRNGKQVTAVTELKARFDEANNILWARRLEEAGVHVIYGIVNHKVHAKIALVVRRDDDGLRTLRASFDR